MRERAVGSRPGRSLAVLLLLLGSVNAMAAPSGAIFTTNVTGTFVNGNVYDHPGDVYLNGGPQPNAPCRAAGLPDGNYFFQVTDPSGKELLSDHGPNNGVVTVSGGIIVAYAGSHGTGLGECGSLTVQLCPYGATPNPGHEYKVWMTGESDYRCDAAFCGGAFGFFQSKSKTDNFKVTGTDPCPPAGPGD